MTDALRLANHLDHKDFLLSVKHIMYAAAELRRLHALNAELVEALRSLVTATEGVSINDYNEEAHDIAVSRARAALTKAGESK